MARPEKMTRLAERVGVTGLTGVLLLPLIPLFIWAFSRRWLFPAVLPTDWELRAWRYLLDPNTRVLAAFSNSLVVALVVTGLSILIALPAARVLGLARFRGKRLVEFLILAPTVVPAFAAAMGIQVLFPHLSVAENVAFGLQVQGENRATIGRKLRDMLARVRLAGFEDRRPRQLSGGQAHPGGVGPRAGGATSGAAAG